MIVYSPCRSGMTVIGSIRLSLAIAALLISEQSAQFQSVELKPIKANEGPPRFQDSPLFQEQQRLPRKLRREMARRDRRGKK